MRLLRNVTLWICGALAVSLLLAAIGLPEKVAVAAGTGVIFAMIAHVGASRDWKELRNKDLLSKDTYKREPNIATAPKRQWLRRRSERMWFLIMLTSIFLAIAACIAFELEGRYFNLIEAVFEGRRTGWGYKAAFWLGVLGTIIGSMFAFFFDHTIGRVLTWVRQGQ